MRRRERHKWIRVVGAPVAAFLALPLLYFVALYVLKFLLEAFLFRIVSDESLVITQVIVAAVIAISGSIYIYGALVWRFRDDPGFCINCGYNLTGLTEPRCPECGQPFEPEGDTP